MLLHLFFRTWIRLWRCEKIIQVGAPKGINRLLQRVGRSNHNLNTPSKAILVPTNRFEFIEAKAAIEEIKNKT